MAKEQITFRDFPGDSAKSFRVRRSLTPTSGKDPQQGGLVVKVEDPKADDDGDTEAEYVDDYDDTANVNNDSFEKSVDVLFE